MSSTLNEKTEEGVLDQTLRPKAWDEYIGQKHIKDNVKILLKAAEERGQIPEHILFYGPPGLGKTTLAHLIAKETNSQMRSTSGPAIEKIGDLASILTNLSGGDILFIDEIQESAKQAEDKKNEDIGIEEDPSTTPAKSETINLPEAPMKYVSLFFLTVLSYVLKYKILFYLLAIVIIYLIIRLIIKLFK